MTSDPNGSAHTPQDLDASPRREKVPSTPHGPSRACRERHEVDPPQSCDRLRRLAGPRQRAVEDGNDRPTSERQSERICLSPTPIVEGHVMQSAEPPLLVEHGASVTDDVDDRLLGHRRSTRSSPLVFGLGRRTILLDPYDHERVTPSIEGRPTCCSTHGRASRLSRQARRLCDRRLRSPHPNRK
jgi:hypothetical protein